MTCGIYMLTFGDNLYYIGLSIDIERRTEQHLQTIKSGRCSDKMLDAYAAFGLPKVEILETCDSISLSEREIYYIQKYDSYYRGLNANRGGGRGSLSLDTFEDVVFNKLKNIYTAYCLNKVSTSRLASYLNIDENFVISALSGKKYSDVRDAFPELYDEATAKYKNTLPTVAHRIPKPTKEVRFYPKLVNDKGEEACIMFGGAKKFAEENGVKTSNLSKLFKGEINRCGVWKLL